jgi:hypothetical protein
MRLQRSENLPSRLLGILSIIALSALLKSVVMIISYGFIRNFICSIGPSEM